MTDEPAPSAELDFFISRRGGAAATAQEVADILVGEGYNVLVQDYDIPYGAQIIAAMHDALKRCRHLIVLLTKDYAASPYTMMELSNFLAAAARSASERRLVLLRVEDCEAEGILAGYAFSDLFDVGDPAERKARILAAVEGRSTAQPRRHKLFENVLPRDDKFTGRDHYLDEIFRLLAGADGAAAGRHVAIHGLGGSGKSALVAEYAHRHAGGYSGVWWAPAEQRATLVSSLAVLAGKLDPRLANLSDQETAAKAALARLAGFATPFLLIYDNVETPEVVRDLLPSLGARIVMTTQWTDWSGRAAEIKLELLSEATAAQFLQARADRVDGPGALRLASALGCLPLALDHAGAYCRLAGPSLSFDDYRKKIDARITRPPRGYPKSVAGTFSMAIEKAVAETADADTLLGVFAFLAPERIPLDLLTDEVLEADARTEALMALAAVSLVEHMPDADAPAVTMHRLVQAAMRAQLAANAGAANVLAKVAHCLAAAIPEGAYDQPGHWPRCAQLLPHALAFREHAVAAKMQDKNFALLCDRIGEFLYARAALDLAQIFFRQAVEVGQVAFGPNDIAVAKAKNNLALALHALGSSGDAEVLLREALAIELEKGGRAHPSYARTLTSLARVLHDRGRMDEAEALLRDAIALGDTNLGRTHADVGERLNILASLLQGKGQTKQAEELFREAIAIGEKSMGREHPQVVFRLNNLALLLHRGGSLDEAERLYREVKTSAEKSLGPEHPYFAACLQNLANLLRDTDHPSEAEQLYLTAIGILAQTLGPSHIYTARARSNFAKLLLANGRTGEARELAQAALTVLASAVAEDHLWRLDATALLTASQQPAEQPQPSAG